MVFLTPIYLFLLIPWAGVAVWVWMGRADFARVSTTQFWDRTPVAAANRRGIRVPPIGILLMLLAMLLTILSAAGIAITRTASMPIRVIVDRGAGSLTAAKASADDLQADLLTQVPADTQLAMAGAPGRVIRADNLAVYLRSLRASAGASDTQKLIEETSKESGRVLAVTDQAIVRSGANVWVLQPRYHIQNAGIESFSIVDQPSVQAMVRIWNDTDQPHAVLWVDETKQAITLPARGESKNYFVDLPAAGETVIARLEIEDEIAADNAAYLVRRGAWARVEAYRGAPEAVGRMIEVYSKHRPASVESATVQIVDTVDDGATPQIVLRPGDARVEGAIRVQNHPVTQHIDWDEIADDIRRTSDRDKLVLAGMDATTLVWIGDTPVLAVAKDRVWIGFDVRSIAAKPAFVLLITNAIDYLAGSSARVWVSESPRDLGKSWRRISEDQPADIDSAPGVYRENDQLLAMSLSPIKSPILHPVETPNWSINGLDRQSQSLATGALMLAILVLTAGLFCLTQTRQRVR